MLWHVVALVVVKVVVALVVVEVVVFVLRLWDWLNIVKVEHCYDINIS